MNIWYWLETETKTKIKTIIKTENYIIVEWVDATTWLKYILICNGIKNT